MNKSIKEIKEKQKILRKRIDPLKKVKKFKKKQSVEGNE